MLAEQVAEKPSLPVLAFACQLKQVSGWRTLLRQGEDGLCLLVGASVRG